MDNAINSRLMEKCCIIDNEIWYANALLNGLFRADMSTGKASYVGIVEETEKYLRRAYSEILYYEGYIYMIPYNAAAIGVYDVSTGEFGKIVVPEKQGQKFNEAVLIEDRIYLLPYMAKRFYCLNTKTKELSPISELRNFNVPILSAIEKNGKIWFAEDRGHSLYCYQPADGELRRIELGEMKGHFSSVGKVGDKIIVAAIDRALALCVTSHTEEITSFEFESYSQVKGERYYYIAEYQGKAILIHINSNDCVVIDIQNGEITADNFCLAKSSIYGKICRNKQGILMFPTVRDKAFHFYKGRTIPLNDEDALLKWKKSNGFDWEGYGPVIDCGLNLLIQMTGIVTVKTSVKGELCGEAVYKRLRN